MPKKRKKDGSRKVEKRLFIVCEGAKDKSEYAYLDSFKQDCRFAGNKAEVVLVDSDVNTGKELVHKAAESREFPQDAAWVVYDQDGYTKHRETFDLAGQEKVKVAFSAISFETWLLLHYEYTARPFLKSEEIIKYMKNKGYLEYSKSATDVYRKIKEKLDTAIENAARLRQAQFETSGAGTPAYEMNPYTDFDKLLQAIKELEKTE